MPGYVNLCTIVDKLLDFWQKCLKSIIYSRRRQDSPIGGSLSNGRAAALIDRATQPFATCTRQNAVADWVLCGLSIRRGHNGACSRLSRRVRLRVASQAICCHAKTTILCIVTECKQSNRRWTDSTRLETRESCFSYVIFLSPFRVREINIT